MLLNGLPVMKGVGSKRSDLAVSLRIYIKFKY